MSSDLQARVRLEAAVGADGPEVQTARPDAEPPKDAPPLVVLDLDQLGVAGTARWARALSGSRVVGFFSHVDEELGRSAEELGLETYRRGRFWRDLPSLVDRGGSH